MKKIGLLLLFYCVLSVSYAQDIYYTKMGNARFFSSAPLENIEATSEKVISFLNMKTGEVQFKIPMKSFAFDKALMQEHFNENYVESDKFPYATFKGKVQNISAFDRTQKTMQTFDIEGNLTIHGVTKKIKSSCTLQPEKKQIRGKSKFMIKVADYDIDIPKIVFQNIAEQVEVTIDVLYQVYQK